MNVKKKSVASFYISGYLMQHRIESDDFLNYKIRLFWNLATKQLKKQECITTLNFFVIWQNFAQKQNAGSERQLTTVFFW
jgi:hypothetical protein